MSFDTILTGKPQPLQQLAMQLKGLALKADKHMMEHVYGGAKSPVALYSIGNLNNVLFGIQLTDRYCVLYLHHTANADTMTLKVEGEKEPRYVKIAAISPEMEKELKEVMKNIVRVSKH